MDASYIPITEARGFTTHWIKTGNEIAAWFQNTPYFMKCFLLIKKCMKTIHTDNGINGFILHLQVPHIPLNTFDMRMTTKSFSGLTLVRNRFILLSLTVAKQKNRCTF